MHYQINLRNIYILSHLCKNFGPDYFKRYFKTQKYPIAGTEKFKEDNTLHELNQVG